MKNQKIDWMAYWRGFTLGFVMLAWIIAVYYLRYPLWVMLPIIFVYLIVNMLIFYSYYLGMVGNFFYQMHQPDAALRYFKKAIARNTKNSTALYNYAYEMLHQGNAEEALKYFELSEKYNTKLFYEKNIPLAKSSCYWVMGGDENIKKAIDILEKLKDSYSYVNTGVYTSLGYFYLLLGDLEKAEEYTNIALEDDSESAPAWDNLGQIRLARNETDSAEEAFLKAIEFRGHMVDSLFFMGVICERRNDKKQALDYYKRAEKCNISSLNTITRDQVEAKIRKLENETDTKTQE